MEDDNQLTEYIQEDLDWDEMIRYLCRPGAEWTLKWTKALHFSHSELSRYGKA